MQNERSAMSTCVWLTGLSGSGKTTLAQLLSQQFNHSGHRSLVLDGDILRSGLNRDLDYSACARHESSRRTAELAKLLVNEGITVFVALISPYALDRAFARSLFQRGRFTEVFVDTPKEVCIQRDVKGLYAQAAQGTLSNMTGMGDPYERPIEAEITVDTLGMTAHACAERIAMYVMKNRQTLKV